MDSQRFDFPSDKDELGGGLGLVSDLLELPKQFEGEETREGSVVQKGRQWFTEGASALVKGTHTLKGNEDTSVRIRRSLFRLDKVLSPDPPSHSLTSGITPTANRVGPLHAIATPLGETSMMSRSRMRDSLLALTPAQDDTFMTMSTHAGPPSSLRMEGTFLGDRDSTMVEDPARKVSGDLVLAFHREFCSHSSPSQCLDMAVALEKCCEVQWNVLTSFEKQTRWSVDQLLSELRMEMATWQLLHVLGRDRLEGGGGAEEERAPERLGRKRESDKELAERLFIQDSSVRQAQLVVDWLEGVARVGLEQYPVKAAYFTDKVCRENTLHDLSHGIDSDVLVTELDPDAPTRQKRKLSELDVKDELALNKHLFTCLRAGQLDKGLAMCVESGNPLKAVMVDGWKLHHDPNLDKKSWDKLDPVEGSEFRDLWKETCWKMVDEPAYDIYEKALYAALSGNVTKILPVCRTWYDYVWAYFKTLVDVQVEKVLRSRTLPSGREWGWLPTKYWSNALLPHQIFQEIEASPSAEIQQQCHSHFHVVQKYIILDDLIGLVDEMFSWLCEPASLSIHRLRFMAHIGLVVKNLERLREETKIHAILEAYVKALTDGHYQSQVALYAAQLPTDAQVNSYAYLLAGVHEEELQRHYLQLGKEAGLDITLVTKAVVENIREIGTGREVSAGLVELGEEVKLTEADQSKIKAIRWLVYDEVHRTEAIRQSNALIRQFLAARKFSAAQAMFQKIPPDSSELVKTVWKQKAGMNPLPEDIVSDLTEHEAIRTYLEAKDAFNVWFQYFHHKKPAMPAEPMESAAFCEKVAYEHSLARYKLEYEHWKSQTNFLVEEAYSRLHAVLVFPGGWMKGHIGVGPDADRDEGLPQQLQVLRQIYIPEIGYLLHSVLHDSVLYKKCLQISDVLTSNEYMLYEDFRPDELRQLLSRLRRSALGLTSDPSTDELGYPIS